MGIDTLIVVLFAGGFVFFTLLLSPLGDKLRNIGRLLKGLRKKTNATQN
jgi:hypothetical protein